MKVKLVALRGFCLGSGVNVEPGEVFEAEPLHAKELVYIGHAAAHNGGEESPPAGAAARQHPDAGTEGIVSGAPKSTAREPGRRPR